MKRNVVGWFEIPVSDMDRAIDFYQSVFGFTIARNTMGVLDMGWFPWVDGDGPGASGSLVCHPDHYVPSKEGTLIYFSSISGDLSDELGRVESAGGTIIQPKTMISEDVGYMAVFTDTEGNRVALHSRG